MSATALTTTTDDEPPLERLTAQILAVHPRQVSDNGNTYTLLLVSSPETPLSTRVFVWDDAWRQEIDQHCGGYYYLDAVLFVRDHSQPDDAEPWYWLEAALPQNDVLTDRFLQRWKRTGQYELFDAAERCVRTYRNRQTADGSEV